VIRKSVSPRSIAIRRLILKFTEMSLSPNKYVSRGLRLAARRVHVPIPKAKGILHDRDDWTVDLIFGIGGSLSLVALSAFSTAEGRKTGDSQKKYCEVHSQRKEIINYCERVGRNQ
jgi:hypothetical protein